MDKTEAIFVLKTVERCNINCTYCYFFNKADQSYQYHPPLMSEATLIQTAKFILDGCKDFGLKHLVICFHGGEPLMQKKQLFENFCSYITDNLDPSLRVTFLIQTNGLLISESWLNLLEKFNVNIGISIDGPKLMHDKYRIDHAGRGTFDRVMAKLDVIRNHRYYKDKGFSVLSVINEKFDANSIYQFFVKELNVKAVDFLIPDNTHDDVSNFSKNQLGKFLSELFTLWINDNPKGVGIRYFNGVLNRFFGKLNDTYGHGPTENLTCLPLVTISSDGSLAPSDEFRSTATDIMITDMNSADTGLRGLIDHQHFKTIETALNVLPEGCSSCLWQNVCQGGGLVNRYSKAAAFNNPSVFCEDLKIFYRNVSIELIKKGMPIEQMIEKLNSEAA